MYVESDLVHLDNLVFSNDAALFVLLYLRKWHNATLKFLVSCSNFKVTQIKKSLTLLIDFGLVSWEKTKFAVIQYFLNDARNKIFMRSYIYAGLVRSRFSQHEAEVIFLLLQAGLLSDSSLFSLLCLKKKEYTVAVIHEALDNLGKGGFLDVISALDQKRESFKLRKKTEFSKLLEDANQSATEPAAKRAKHDNEETIYYACNVGKLNALWRNQIIVEDAMSEISDEMCTAVFRIILTQFEIPNITYKPDYIIESAFNSTREKQLPNVSEEKFSECLNLLHHDVMGYVQLQSCPISRSIIIPFKSIIEKLFRKFAESVVSARFGGEGLMMFTTLLQKPNILKEEWEFRTLLSPKQFNLTLRQMIAEGFVYLKELNHIDNYQLPKMTCLFYMDEESLARKLLKDCYEGISKLRCRQKHQLSAEKGLLSKFKDVEEIEKKRSDKQADTSATLCDESIEICKGESVSFLGEDSSNAMTVGTAGRREQDDEQQQERDEESDDDMSLITTLDKTNMQSLYKRVIKVEKLELALFSNAFLLEEFIILKEERKHLIRSSTGTKEDS